MPLKTDMCFSIYWMMVINSECMSRKGVRTGDFGDCLCTGDGHLLCSVEMFLVITWASPLHRASTVSIVHWELFTPEPYLSALTILTPLVCFELMVCFMPPKGPPAGDGLWAQPERDQHRVRRLRRSGGGHHPDQLH